MQKTQFVKRESRIGSEDNPLRGVVKAVAVLHFPSELPVRKVS